MRLTSTVGGLQMVGTSANNPASLSRANRGRRLGLFNTGLGHDVKKLHIRASVAASGSLAAKNIKSWSGMLAGSA